LALESLDVSVANLTIMSSIPLLKSCRRENQ